MHIINEHPQFDSGTPLWLWHGPYDGVVIYLTDRIPEQIILDGSVYQTDLKYFEERGDWRAQFVQPETNG